jgi:type IV secretion system protein VirB9
MKKIIISLTALSLVTSTLASPLVQEFPGAYINGKYIPPEQNLPIAPYVEPNVSIETIPIQPYSHTQKIDSDKNLDTIASSPKPKETAQPRKIPAADAARLAAAKKWEESGQADALVGVGGTIEYPYGYSRPTIICAPLHICSIALQEGENVTSVSLGDHVRWLLQNTTAGNKPVLAIKPTQAGLSTNLMVTTDKGRVYYMHLLSSKTDYMPMVTWYDPAAMTRDLRAEAEAAARKKAEFEATLQAAKLAAEQAKAQRIVADKSMVGGLDPTTLDFNYSCEGEARFKPARVFSNDTHTFIQLPADAKTGDAPAVFNISNNQTELLNARLNNGYYIIDGKPEKLSLVLGVGNNAQTVKCEKKAAKTGFWGGR